MPRKRLVSPPVYILYFRGLQIKDHCPEACCALVFDDVLGIRTSEKMYETYSELLRNRMVFLTPGSDNSISKLGAE